MDGSCMQIARGRFINNRGAIFFLMEKYLDASKNIKMCFVCFVFLIKFYNNNWIHLNYTFYILNQVGDGYYLNLMLIWHMNIS